MIKKFDTFNEEIGFKVPGMSNDEPKSAPIRKKLGFKLPGDSDETYIDIENEEEREIPKRLKGRNSYMASDVIEILSIIKDRTDMKTASIIDEVAEDLGLTEIMKPDFVPLYKKVEKGTNIRNYDVPEL